MARPRKKTSSITSSNCSLIHFNNLWSVWYGAIGGILQIFVALKCTKRLLNYSILNWPDNLSLPTFEMNTSLVLTGAGILLIPFFVVTAIFKVGNLANDGHKLGRHLDACSKETPLEVLGTASSCSLWRFGGPTAPFLHIVIAFCLLLPKLLMEARLIQANFFPQELIWHTDLDFITVYKEKFVMLNFVTLTNDTVKTLPKTSYKESVTTTVENSILEEMIAPKNPSTLTNTVMNVLKEYIGTDEGNVNNMEFERGNYASTEYLNFALALGIYAIRYSSLFWATNKGLCITFSIQLMLNGIQILVSYCGVSILYKVQVMGGVKVLPFLSRHIGKPTDLFEPTPFLLNAFISIMLYILYILLIISSSLIFYTYGHIRFKNFVSQNCQRKVILLKEKHTVKWTYFTHCAALFLIIAIGVSSAPLFYDYIVVYKGSLDNTMLVCIIEGVMHLFLWIVLWLFLTIKQNWIFKLRITIGKTLVKHSASIMLAAEVLSTGNKRRDNLDQPLLVANNGYIYSVTDSNTKTDIVDVLKKDICNNKERSKDSLHTNNSENQIYWLKSELLDSKINNFKYTKASPVDSQVSNICAQDDGDYATLKKPESFQNSEDNLSEVDKLLSEVHMMNVSYANTSDDLVPIDMKKDTKSTLEVVLEVPNTESSTSSTTITQKTHYVKSKKPNGIVHEEATKYDSISMESSSSPPDNPDSETSSGVHSNESGEHLLYGTTHQNTSKCPETKEVKDKVRWKSCSLHRCVRPFSAEAQTNANKYYSLNPNLSSVHEPYGTKPVCSHISQMKNSSEATLVICRKLQPFKIGESVYPTTTEEQFGRSTNMRMSSFTEHSTFVTVPYCTPSFAGKGVYMHTTMSVLPELQSVSQGFKHNQNSLYTRQHTTIPSHHKTVELCPKKEQHVSKQ